MGQMTQQDIIAAFKRGKLDALAGRSRNATRYADAARDAAWDRGFSDQLQAMRRENQRTARTRRKSCE